MIVNHSYQSTIASFSFLRRLIKRCLWEGGEIVISSDYDYFEMFEPARRRNNLERLKFRKCYISGSNEISFMIKNAVSESLLLFHFHLSMFSFPIDIWLKWLTALSNLFFIASSCLFLILILLLDWTIQGETSSEVESASIFRHKCVATHWRRGGEFFNNACFVVDILLLFFGFLDSCQTIYRQI